MPGHFYHFVVTDDDVGERLDRFLTSKLPDMSRARLQKIIADGNIRVNSVPITKSSQKMRFGESVHVIVPEPTPTDILPESIPLDIVYEDEFLLVVNKPANMVVHPAYANYTGTLVNALLYYCQNLSDMGGVQRPGIVHRLDKDTSGLLVVAKDDYTHAALAKQFSEHTIEREYRAVVWGHLQEKSGQVETKLARSPKDRTRITVQQIGKHAVTRYSVLEEFDFTSFLKLNLLTGRTHQIRVHMAFIGHPVFSDGTYGGRGNQINNLNKAQSEFAIQLLQTYKRQMLHARVLGFIHPKTDEKMYFEKEPPTEMLMLLKKLREPPV